MRATRKWVKLTVSGGIVCFTCTLYILCLMAPPGGQNKHKPPGGEIAPDIHKRHILPDVAKTTADMLTFGGQVKSMSSDNKSVAETLPTSQPDTQSKVLQGTNSKTTDELNCENDCAKLRQTFSKWPKSKPKAVISYLTQSRRLPELRKSLESLDQNFNNKYQYPIVIFHESDLTASIPTIRQWTSSTLYFQPISFALPEFLTAPTDIECVSSVSYRHMCRFQAKLVHEHPILDGMDYMWRLDDESLLTKPVEYDVFVYMRDRQLLYGYIWEHVDSLSCVAGLWEATENYIQKYNVPPNRFPEWKEPKLYYNNFEISSLALWRSPEYRLFIDYLDRLGGIYYHRWGDAPIKGIAVSLFVPSNKLHYFKDIGYQHNTFKNTPE